MTSTFALTIGDLTVTTCAGELPELYTAYRERATHVCEIFFGINRRMRLCFTTLNSRYRRREPA